MEEEDMKQFLNKPIKLRLSGGFFYTCKIEQLTEDSVHIVDKYGERHVFDISEIKGVSESHKEENTEEEGNEQKKSDA